MSIAARSAKQTYQTLNVGDLSIYVAGGGIPEGNYALVFTPQNYQATKQDGSVAGPPRFGIMIEAHSLDDPSAEPKTKFLSLGSKAMDAFMPHPDNPKKVILKPDGPGVQTLTQSSNWAIFLQSMYHSGLPQGVFTDDFSAIDGVHVHLTNIPEPEERKGFQRSSTAEVQQAPRQNQTIPAVTEILDGGAPWEGGGGIPQKEAAKPNGKAGRETVTITKKDVGTLKLAKTAPAPEPTESDPDEAILDAAVRGISSVFEKNPEGCARLILKTQTLKAVTKTDGEDVGSAVIDTFFASDDALNSVLNQLGYQVTGQKVAPMLA